MKIENQKIFGGNQQFDNIPNLEFILDKTNNDVVGTYIGTQTPIERLRNKLSPFINLAEVLNRQKDFDVANLVETCMLYKNDIHTHLADCEKFYSVKKIENEENKTEIEWREQNSKFGLDYSTKTGKWEDYKFDIRYDYDGNPDEKPKKCLLGLTIMKNNEIIEREKSYNIEDLVSYSEIYMLDEQRKFLKGKFR